MVVTLPETMDASRPPATTAPIVAPGRPSHALRLGYLDNLKIVLVAGVIVDHAAGLYVGGGYGYKGNGLSYAALAVLWTVFGVGTMFAMGTFFFMAGWLTPASLVRKGANPYLLDRFLRLGVPWLASILVITPVCWFVGTFAASGSLGLAWKAAVAILVNPDPGVAWFLSVLLIFTVAFVAYRHWRPASTDSRQSLSVGNVLAAAVIIIAVTFPVRLLFLAGSNQVLGLHMWQSPQYLTLFLMGALAAERGWLDQVSRRVWLVLALAVVGAGITMTAALFGSGAGIDFEPFRGGWHWQAVCFAISEGALSVSLTLILFALFRRYVNRQSRLLRTVSKDAYVAFVIQSPVLVIGALMLRDVPLPAELKFIVLGAAAVAGSFAAAHLLRRVALVRRIA